MVIAKLASRNVAFKSAKLTESVFACQSDVLTRQVATDLFVTTFIIVKYKVCCRYINIYLYSYISSIQQKKSPEVSFDVLRGFVSNKTTNYEDN